MKFYGQFKLDEFLYNNFFKNHRNGFFVECGAFDGLTEVTCKFFEEFMNWSGINLEPVPYIYNKLVKNRPKSINLDYALSDFNGPSIFTQAIHPKLGNSFGNGSLKHAEAHKKQLISQKCSFETFKVECRRFVDIFAKYTKEIDLFVLDVEGHELSALEGILPLDNKYLPKVFCIEYPIVGLDCLSKKLKGHYALDKTYRNNAIFIKNS